MKQNIIETDIVIVSVEHKTGVGAKGKYDFYNLLCDDGTKYSANDPKWEGMIGGPHHISYTEKQNGKYLNRSIYEARQYSRSSRPPETKRNDEAMGMLGEILAIVTALDLKVDSLVKKEKVG